MDNNRHDMNNLIYIQAFHIATRWHNLHFTIYIFPTTLEEPLIALLDRAPVLPLFYREIRPSSRVISGRNIDWNGLLEEKLFQLFRCADGIRVILHLKKRSLPSSHKALWNQSQDIK
ncbi:hypothetical protein Pelo_17141 [Pelomyxa schiedti]|nr:hypothetical protein Pelo_17141 [Pelomyxa schiedti]